MRLFGRLSSCLSGWSSELYREFETNISTEDDVIIFFSYVAKLSALIKTVKNTYYVLGYV